MGLVFQFLMPTIGGLLFAWAAIRSGGLALPIGLHLGGNWVQASVAVFGPHPAPGAAESFAGLWRIPISASRRAGADRPGPPAAAAAAGRVRDHRGPDLAGLRRPTAAQLLAPPKQ